MRGRRCRTSHDATPSHPSVVRETRYEFVRETQSVSPRSFGTLMAVPFQHVAREEPLRPRIQQEALLLSAWGVVSVGFAVGVQVCV